MTNILYSFTLLISLFCLIYLLTGMIDPNWVIICKIFKKRTRDEIFKYYGTGFLIALLINTNLNPLKAKEVTIGTFSLLICLFCLICLIILSTRPNLIIKSEDVGTRTKKKLFKCYGIVLIIALTVFFIINHSFKNILNSFGMLELLLSLFLLISLIIGIVKPHIVITWGNVELKNRKKVFKFYGVWLLVSLVILFVTAGISCSLYPTLAQNKEAQVTNASQSNTQNEDAKKSDDAKKTEEIKSLQTKYKPVLQSGKIYEAMNDEERSIADDLITNWNKLQQDFKSSYQSQKDALSTSKNEYVTKWKAEQDAKKAEQEKASYDTGITYTQLARNPDDYKWKKAKFTGKVIQVIEGKTETDLRIAVNNNYDNILYIKYDPSILKERVLENDHVTVYGESIGIYSYNSTLGTPISIPGMSVKNIEINN